MLFIQLPVDILRQILGYIDEEDAHRLQQTNDGSILRLLSSPGLFGTVSLNCTSERRKLITFYRALRNIERVLMQEGSGWPVAFLPSLLDLNPLHFKLPIPFLDDNDLFLITQERHLLSDEMKRVKSLLSPLLLPKLSILTPRLTSLSFRHRDNRYTGSPSAYDEYVKSVWERSEEPEFSPKLFYCFPPSLTEFNIDQLREKEAKPVIKALPTTLRKLTVGNFESGLVLSSVVSRFPQLENFTFGTMEQILWKPSTALKRREIPSSLETLRFGMPSIIDTVGLLQKSDFKHSKVSNLALIIFENPDLSLEIDLKNLLPPTMLNLLVSFETAHSFINKNLVNCSIVSLPPQLTCLTLQINHNDSSLLAAIAKLPYLSTLKISTSVLGLISILGPGDQLENMALEPKGPSSKLTDLNDPAWQCLVHASSLPRSLTHLVLRRSLRYMTKAVIAALPRSLKHLSVPYCSLQLLPLIQETFPECHLFITQPLHLWSSVGEAHLRLDKIIASPHRTLDLSAWARDLSRHFTQQRVHFLVSLAQGTYTGPASDAEEVSLTFIPDTLQGFVSVMFRSFFNSLSLYPSMTCLSVQAPQLEERLNLIALPPTLTSLILEVSAKCIITLGDQLPPNIVKISTQSNCALSKGLKQPSKLSHFYAPNWDISARTLLDWDMNAFTCFCVNIKEMTDIQVADFITGSTPSGGSSRRLQTSL